MCRHSCIAFGSQQLLPEEVAGRQILEVGARDVNGSLRGLVQAMGPGGYLGIDIEAGPGVDEICNVYELIERYGTDSFDVVVSTDMLEHVELWKEAVHNMKGVLRPGGVLLLTAPTHDFPRHEYPGDFWRFEADDLAKIFADLTLEALESNPMEMGVYLKARKPMNFVEVDLKNYEVYAVP